MSVLELRQCDVGFRVASSSLVHRRVNRALGLLYVSFLGGTALALLIGAGSGAWAQSVEGGAATGSNSLAVGSYASAYSTSAVAIGPSAKAGSSDTTVNSDFATAVGAGAIARGYSSTALGEVAYAISINSSAIGMASNALGSNATAVGVAATAGVFGDNAVIQGTAIGAFAKASASNATALGYGAKAMTVNSVALGANSVTGTANESSSVTLGGMTYNVQGAASAATTSVVSVGGLYNGALVTRQIQNVAAGLLSATSTDAVNGSQLYATNLALNSILGARYGLNSGSTSLALGVGSVAGVSANPTTNYQATALGVQSQATGVNTTALGYNAQATQTDSLALGANSLANAAATPVSGDTIGGQQKTYAGATPNGVVSIGGNSVNGVVATRQIQNVAAGRISADSTDAVNGSQLYATNQVLALAVGDIATVTGRVDAVERNISDVTTRVGMAEDDIKTLGAGIKTVSNRLDSFTGDPSGAQSLALGATSVASQTSSTALGYGAKASTANSVALGAGSDTGSVHTGSEAMGVNLVGTKSTFAGAATDTSGLVSVGTAGHERQIQNVAAGQVNAMSTDAVNGSQLYVAYQAIGALNTTLTGVSSRLGAETGASSSAYGASSKASGDYATAIGYNAQASAPNSVALGANSVAADAHSSANAADYGFSGAVAATAKGVLSVGSAKNERQIQNVAAGLVTSTSTDAVNGSQLYATNQAIDRANQSVASLGQSLDALASGVNQLSNRVGVVQKEARGGIAAAVALVNAPMPSQAGKTSWAGNVAKFRDQYAMGFSFAHRLNSNLPLAMTAGVAYAPGTRDVTGRVGMAGEF